MPTGPDHYVAATGDYDRPADDHLEGEAVIDKRSTPPDDSPELDPYDDAEREFIESCREHRSVLDDVRVQFDDGRVLHYFSDIDSIVRFDINGYRRNPVD